MPLPTLSLSLHPCRRFRPTAQRGKKREGCTKKGTSMTRDVCAKCGKELGQLIEAALARGDGRRVQGGLHYVVKCPSCSVGYDVIDGRGKTPLIKKPTMGRTELLRKIVQVVSRQQFPCAISAGPYDFWKEFEGIDKGIIEEGLLTAIRNGYLEGRPREARAFQGSQWTISIRRVTPKGKDFIEGN